MLGKWGRFCVQRKGIWIPAPQSEPALDLIEGRGGTLRWNDKKRTFSVSSVVKRPGFPLLDQVEDKLRGNDIVGICVNRRNLRTTNRALTFLRSYPLTFRPVLSVASVSSVAEMNLDSRSGRE
jgi:hypothetical protein